MGICTALYSIYIDMMKNLLLPQHTHEFTQPFNHINLIHVLIVWDFKLWAKIKPKIETAAEIGMINHSYFYLKISDFFRALKTELFDLFRLGLL